MLRFQGKDYVFPRKSNTKKKLGNFRSFAGTVFYVYGVHRGYIIKYFSI